MGTAPISRRKQMRSVAPGLLDAFASLLDDGEVEVRAAAFQSCVAVAKLLPKHFAASEGVMASTCGGADNRVEFKVRLAAAGALARLLGALAPVNGAPQTAQDTIFRTVDARLFSDEHVEVALCDARCAGGRRATPQRRSCKSCSIIIVRGEPRERQLAGPKSSVECPTRTGAGERQKGLRGTVSPGFGGTLPRPHRGGAEECGGDTSAIAGPPEDPSNEDGPRLFDGDWLMSNVGSKLKSGYGDLEKYLHRVTVVQAFEQLSHEQLRRSTLRSSWNFFARLLGTRWRT